MLTLQIPMLLALLGTALMAVVIFAPAPAAATVTTSCAPPLVPPPLEHWSPAAEPFAPQAFEGFAAPRGPDESPEPAVAHAPLAHAPDVHALQERAPAWPALVDPRAAGCDAAARLALVEALAAVRAPWADAVLHRAFGEEPDAAVRAALGAALAP